MKRTADSSTVLLAAACAFAAVASVTVALAENVLPNGSFELGMCNWYWQATDADVFQARAAVEWEDLLPDVREEGAWHGQRCVRLALGERQRMMARSGWMQLPAKQPRTFSIFLKRARTDANAVSGEVELWVESPAGGGRSVVGRVKPTGAWQRFSVTQPAGLAAGGWVRAGVRVDGPQAVEMDAAQLEAGDKATAFATRLAAEVAVTAASSDHWFTGDDTPTLVAAVATCEPQGPATRQVRLVATDFNGREIFAREVTVNMNTNKLPVALAPLTARAFGNFRVRAELVGAEPDHDETQLNVTRPVAMRPPARASVFGATLRLKRGDFDLAEKMGVRWLRLPLVTQWFVVEPKRDQWHWFDEPLRAAWRRGLEVLGALDASAHWENDAQDRGSRPEEWDNYVRQTVGHYHRWIRAWEVWNEPDQPGLLAGRDQTDQLKNYVDLLKRTYAAAKEADPACLVVGGALGDARFAPKLIELGALPAMDVLSLHMRSASALEDFETRKPSLAELLGAVRAAMKARGGEKPVWITAGGLNNVGSSYREGRVDGPWRANRKTTARDAAALLARQYAIAMASGVEKFFYDIAAAPTAAEEEATGFTESDGSPTAVAAAYATASGLLDGATFLKRHDLGGGARALEFQRAGENGRVLVAWATAETGVEVAMPAGWASAEVRALDVMGNLVVREGAKARLTRSPAYLVTTQ
ncbi:MAG: hypothetical protein HZA91_01790 [Verrucomicrobia bacterium]|nr:hypothetical protein [Verrucomicrobiota bacterium]